MRRMTTLIITQAIKSDLLKSRMKTLCSFFRKTMNEYRIKKATISVKE